jgi:hypothetical protein
MAWWWHMVLQQVVRKHKSYSKVLPIILCIVLASCCQNSDSTTSDNQAVKHDENIPVKESSIVINGRMFSIDEINAGIKDTFNCSLYYHGYDSTSPYLFSNIDIVLHQNIEYELYYDPYCNDGKDPFYRPKKFYIIITNKPHPLSTDENPLAYVFGFDVTEYGLRSDFSSHGHVPRNKPFIAYGKELPNLGSYTMRLDEIEKPQFEVMDTEWIENTKEEIRMYMDWNNFHQGAPEKNLEPGNYHVYVQKFFKSDADSTIIFEHENGNIYTGIYYFVHENTGNHLADLNHVELIEYADDESFKEYLEKVRSDPAVSLQYSVLHRGGTKTK